MLPVYQPPVFVDDSPSGPYLDDDYFNGVGGVIRDITKEVNLLQSDKLHHSFRNKANGSVGTTADSGQAFVAVGPTVPQVASGAVGFPAGFNSNGSQTASYLMVEMPSAVTRIKGKFRFDAADGDANKSNVTLGVFNSATISTATQSPCHLSITPTYMEMSFGSGNNDFGAVPAEGHPTNGITFPYPLRTDGATEYEVDIILDKVNGRCYVRLGNLPVYMWRDERIKLDNRFIFWETFVNQPTVGYGGFLEIAGDDRIATFDQLNAFRGSVGFKTGSTPNHRRPSSKLRSGLTWFDTTTDRLTWSNGSVWRDFEGNVIGNQFTDNEIAPYSANPWSVDGATKKIARSHSTSRFPTCIEVTLTGGECNTYQIMTTNLPVAGQQYSFVVAEAMTRSQSPRNARLDVRFYNSEYAIIDQQQSDYFVVPTDKPASSPIITMTVPANTTVWFMMLNIPNGQTGDVFNIAGFCRALGTATGFVER